MPNGDNRKDLITAELAQFQRVKLLGQGEFGLVSLYSYTGDDPQIVSLTNTGKSGGLLIVKEFKEAAINTDEIKKNVIARLGELSGQTLEFWINNDIKRIKADNQLAIEADRSEKSTINYLASTHRQGEEASYPLSSVIQAGDKTWIIAQVISYGINVHHEPVSSDLEKFMQSLSTNMSFASDNPAAMAGLERMLNSFTASLVSAQHHLNSKGVLHMDTAIRNFLVCQPEIKEGELTFGLKICDFGLSKIMSDTGKAALINEVGSPVKLPILYMNNEMFLQQRMEEGGKQYVKREFSVHTDIFSRKVAIMEMLGTLAGMNFKESFLQNRDYLNSRRGMSDTNVLEIYLNSVKQAALALTVKKDEQGNIINRVNDWRSQIILDFITSYEPYLTRVPDSKLGKEEALAADFKSFSESAATHQALLSKKPSIKAEDMLAAIMPTSLSPPKPALSSYAVITEANISRRSDVYSPAPERLDNSGYLPASEPTSAYSPVPADMDRISAKKSDSSTLSIAGTLASRAGAETQEVLKEKNTRDQKTELKPPTRTEKAVKTPSSSVSIENDKENKENVPTLRKR